MRLQRRSVESDHRRLQKTMRMGQYRAHTRLMRTGTNAGNRPHGVHCAQVRQARLRTRRPQRPALQQGRCSNERHVVCWSCCCWLTCTILHTVASVRHPQVQAHHHDHAEASGLRHVINPDFCEQNQPGVLISDSGQQSDLPTTTTLPSTCSCTRHCCHGSLSWPLAGTFTPMATF